VLFRRRQRARPRACVLSFCFWVSKREPRKKQRTRHAKQGRGSLSAPPPLPHLCRQQDVQRVAVVAQRHAAAGRQPRDLDRLVHVDHVLALRVHLDEDLGLAHDLLCFLQVLVFGSERGGGKRDVSGRLARGGGRDRSEKRTKKHKRTRLDDLADVGSRLLEQLELLAQQAHCSFVRARRKRGVCVREGSDFAFGARKGAAKRRNGERLE